MKRLMATLSREPLQNVPLHMVGITVGGILCIAKRWSRFRLTRTICAFTFCDFNENCFNHFRKITLNVEIYKCLKIVFIYIKKDAQQKFTKWI